MRSQASFQQILEEKLQAHRPQSLADQAFDQNTLSQDPAHLAYLLGHLGTTFIRPQTQKIYPARPKPPAPPHVLSETQTNAREFFALRGVELSPAFSARELKKAFRSLALKLHPDMNKGASGAFIELKKNYETLLELFAQP